MESYKNYVASAKGKLLIARSESKLWWNLSRELLSQRKKVQSIPAFKSEPGIWIHGQSEKADLLARTFSSKTILPEPEENEYTELECTGGRQGELRTLKVEDAKRTIEVLDEYSDTGPDLLPVRSLKHCAA